MNRRDFFSASALGAYSLVVLADTLPAPQGPLPTKRDFDRIAPPSGKPGAIVANRT
jgi:hypothetical protein